MSGSQAINKDSTETETSLNGNRKTSDFGAMGFGSNFKYNQTNDNSNDNLKSRDPNQRIKENLSAPRKGVSDSTAYYNIKEITHESDKKSRLEFKKSVETLQVQPIQNLKVSLSQISNLFSYEHSKLTCNKSKTNLDNKEFKTNIKNMNMIP